MSRLLIILIAVGFLGSCSPDDGVLPFSKCWQFEKIASNKFKVSFEAVIYPRSGVISYNQRCPRLRLSLIFKGKSNSLESKIFNTAEAKGFGITGFTGVAVILPERQNDRLVLPVLVESLTEARILPKDETDRLSKQMDNPI